MLRKEGLSGAGAVNQFRQIIVSSHVGLLKQSLEKRTEVSKYMMHNTSTQGNYMREIATVQEQTQKAKDK